MDPVCVMPDSISDFFDSRPADPDSSSNRGLDARRFAHRLSRSGGLTALSRKPHTSPGGVITHTAPTCPSVLGFGKIFCPFPRTKVPPIVEVGRFLILRAHPSFLLPDSRPSGILSAPTDAVFNMLAVLREGLTPEAWVAWVYANRT
jgi:hypothetical protein